MTTATLTPEPQTVPLKVPRLFFAWKDLSQEVAQFFNRRWNADGIYIYEDGKVLDGPTLYEPSRVEYQRLLVAREYLRKAMAEEIKAFNRKKQEVIDQAAMHRRFNRLPPGVGRGVAQELLEGRDRIFALRQKYQQIQAALAQTPEVKARAERQALERELAQQQWAEFDRWESVIRQIDLTTNQPVDLGS